MTPVTLLRSRLKPLGQHGSTKPEHARSASSARRWVCRTCGAYIADPAALFLGHGASSRAVFANPHGRVFEIFTLRGAENLLPVGSPTSEFTWFPGFAWTVVVCATCFTHLGWRFDGSVGSSGADTFYGLLCAELVERDD